MNWRRRSSTRKRPSRGSTNAGSSSTRVK
jgi:hypothetical protein